MSDDEICSDCWLPLDDHCEECQQCWCFDLECMEDEEDAEEV